MIHAVARWHLRGRKVALRWSGSFIRSFTLSRQGSADGFAVKNQPNVRPAHAMDDKFLIDRSHAPSTVAVKLQNVTSYQFISRFFFIYFHLPALAPGCNLSAVCALNSTGIHSHTMTSLFSNLRKCNIKLLHFADRDQLSREEIMLSHYLPRHLSPTLVQFYNEKCLIYF